MLYPDTFGSTSYMPLFTDITACYNTLCHMTMIMHEDSWEFSCPGWDYEGQLAEQLELEESLSIF